MIARIVVMLSIIVVLYVTTREAAQPMCVSLDSQVAATLE